MLIVLGALLGLATLAWLGIRLVLGPSLPAYRVTVKPLVQTVVATGRLSSVTAASLGATVTARVVATPVEEGSTVRKGAVLLRLESDEAVALRAQAQAAVAQAEATLAEARRHYQRQHGLFTQGFISQAAMDSEAKALQLAQAQLDAASQQRTATDVRLSQLTVRAPADGVLVKRNVEAGALVTAGSAALTFAPAGQTEVLLDMDERYLARLALGQPARVAADAYPQAPFEAKVVRIAPLVNRERGTVEVRLQPAGALPAGLRQDMTVSAEIIAARKNAAMVLPASAVHDSALLTPWVWAVQSGRVVKRTLRLGLVTDGWAEVLQGLQPGERVLTGDALVTAGERVRVTEAD
ncbi:MAG TPA: efflux RND transporter periplasmic adaptor subunit [Chromobacteriaceae bacterium]|nr:efflux RND transporter periplasmic adaptor subunit [Chromobacteriaceae bacterium]